jgi:hypothetical protein
MLFFRQFQIFLAAVSTMGCKMALDKLTSSAMCAVVWYYVTLFFSQSEIFVAAACALGSIRTLRLAN